MQHDDNSFEATVYPPRSEDDPFRQLFPGPQFGVPGFCPQTPPTPKSHVRPTDEPAEPPAHGQIDAKDKTSTHTQSDLIGQILQDFAKPKIERLLNLDRHSLQDFIFRFERAQQKAFGNLNICEWLGSSVVYSLHSRKVSIEVVSLF